MADLPLYLLLNKLRPERGQPDATLDHDEDVHWVISEFSVTRTYVAFDFDIEKRGDEPGWRDLTPRDLVNAAIRAGGQEQFPQFFCPLKHGGEGVDGDAKGHFFADLPGQLDPAQLHERAMNSHLHEACRLASKGIDQVQYWRDETRQRTEEAYKGLLVFCTKQFTDPKGEPLQVPDQNFADAFGESLRRTAPLYVYPGLWLHAKVSALGRKARDIHGWAADILAKVKNPYAPIVRDTLARHGLHGVHFADPGTIAKDMHALRWLPAEIDVCRLREAWAQVLKNVDAYSLPVNSSELDQMAGDFWSSCGRRKLLSFGLRYGLLTVISASAGLAGLSVAVDGGATLFASFSLAGSLSAAIPGVPAIMVGAVGTGGAFAAFMNGAITHNTIPALSVRFDFACDVFHVPRRCQVPPPLSELPVAFGRDRDRRTFGLLKVDSPRLDAVCPLPAMFIWKQHDEGLQQYRKAIDDCG
jgi:hypothetical protein